MKEKILFNLLVVIALLCNTCQKETDVVPYEEGIQKELLSDEDVLFLDNLESVELSADQVVLSNGQTLDEYLLMHDPDFYNEINTKSTLAINLAEPKMTKDLLVARLTAVAIKLTDRSKFVYPEGPVIGQPAQNGLAYSFGSKQYKERKRPSEGECTAEVYGLDCSGLIYQLFYQSGVKRGLWTTAEAQRRPDTLMKYIQIAFPDLENLKIENLGKIALTEVQSGDIIYFLGTDGIAKHIGMILKNSSGNLYVAQSNGTGKISGDCSKNYGPSRGPRFFGLNASIQPGNFGDNYGIVRINIEEPEPLDFTKCGVMIRVYGYYHKTTPQSSWDQESNNGTIQSKVSSGNFEGNTFTGSYSETVGTDAISGSITAVLNETHDVLVSLNWTETTTFGASPSDSRVISCELENVPMVNTSHFEVEGENACNHISSFSDEQNITGGLSFSLTSYRCTSGSKVMVYFSK